MRRKAKVMFAELSFDALPISETSDVFERVEHDGLNGSRQVTFVYDDLDCPCRSNLQGGTFKVFEEYLRNEIEGKFVSEILRLESLGSFPRLSFSLGSVKAGCGNTEVSREMIGELADRGMSFRSKGSDPSI